MLLRKKFEIVFLIPNQFYIRKPIELICEQRNGGFWTGIVLRALKDTK